MEKDKLPYVYLDATHLDSEYLINRFSFIYNECLARGTDITKECIKVSPAQHYFMGGIHVDLDSKHLWKIYMQLVKLVVQVFMEPIDWQVIHYLKGLYFQKSS